VESIPGDLLEHAAWVRRLARRLVRDAAAADDVVQETWLAALKARRASDATLRPWLARVAANFARDRGRSEANRAERERSRAGSGLEPSAAETAERLEAQRLLVDALAALAEPYRTTVALRYLDGLSAARIARRLGVPAGTVRWRLKQGLDQLRLRLEARAQIRGDRSPGAWCLLLLPLLRRPPLAETAIALPAATLQGILAMNAMTKLGIAAAIVVTASVGVWIAVDPPAAYSGFAAAAPELPEPIVSAAPEDSKSASPLAPVAENQVREAVAITAEPAPRSGHGETPAASATRLEARFLDGAGRPVARVVLELPDLDGTRSEPSDAEGRIALGLDRQLGTEGRERSTDFRATCEGFATAFGNVTVERGRVTYLGDLTLQPGGSVAGRVFGPDGAPVASARVLVTPPELDATTYEARVHGPSHSRDVFESTTARDGSFRIDGVRAGLARAWASANGMRWAASDAVEVPASAVRGGIELRLEPLAPEDTIEGIVLSPSGEPVPEADIRFIGRGAAGTWSGNFSAGLDGRFQHRLPVRGRHDLTARDPSRRWTNVTALGVEPGTHDLVLRFPELRHLEITVRGEGSMPILEYAARVLSADRSRVLVPDKMAEHEGGRARLVVPAERFLVEVRARGHGSAELGPFEPEEAPASAACTLERRPGVRGRVRSDGQPVAGARVALHEMSDEETLIESNGFATRLHPHADDEAISDADGWYELDPNQPDPAEGMRFFQREPGAPARFSVLCEAEGYARAEVSPIDIDPVVGLDGVDIELSAGGAIEGRVRVPKGRDPAGIVVAIDRCDGHARTERVGPDGVYRFDHLTPGRWNVVRAEAELRAGSISTSWSRGGSRKASYPSNCTVTEGATTRFDLDLSDDRGCVLAARLQVGGAPGEGWSAVLHPEEGSTAKRHPGGVFDSGGTLRLDAGEPGTFELEIRPPASSGSQARFTLPVTLAKGENPLALAWSVGSVRGHLLAPAPDARIVVESFADEPEGLACRVEVGPDAKGEFEVPLVMAGRARVARMRALEGGGTEGPVAEVQVEIPAGGVVEASVP
jgi:RNA polymerase sigma-70 factor (ECF subfamily)